MSWRCASCENINERGAKTCEVCQTTKSSRSWAVDDDSVSRVLDEVSRERVGYYPDETVQERRRRMKNAKTTAEGPGRRLGGSSGGRGGNNRSKYRRKTPKAPKKSPVRSRETQESIGAAVQSFAGRKRAKPGAPRCDTCGDAVDVETDDDRHAGCVCERCRRAWCERESCFPFDMESFRYDAIVMSANNEWLCPDCVEKYGDELPSSSSEEDSTSAPSKKQHTPPSSSSSTPPKKKKLRPHVPRSNSPPLPPPEPPKPPQERPSIYDLLHQQALPSRKKLLDSDDDEEESEPPIYETTKQLLSDDEEEEEEDVKVEEKRFIRPSSTTGERAIELSSGDDSESVEESIDEDWVGGEQKRVMFEDEEDDDIDEITIADIEKDRMPMRQTISGEEAANYIALQPKVGGWPHPMLPYFLPVSVLKQRSLQGDELLHIDYLNQFGDAVKADVDDAASKLASRSQAMEKLKKTANKKPKRRRRQRARRRKK